MTDHDDQQPDIREGANFYVNLLRERWDTDDPDAQHEKKMIEDYTDNIREYMNKYCADSWDGLVVGFGQVKVFINWILENYPDHDQAKDVLGPLVLVIVKTLTFMEASDSALKLSERERKDL